MYGVKKNVVRFEYMDFGYYRARETKLANLPNSGSTEIRCCLRLVPINSATVCIIGLCSKATEPKEMTEKQTKSPESDCRARRDCTLDPLPSQSELEALMVNLYQWSSQVHKALICVPQSECGGWMTRVPHLGSPCEVYSVSPGWSDTMRHL